MAVRKANERTAAAEAEAADLIAQAKTRIEKLEEGGESEREESKKRMRRREDESNICFCSLTQAQPYSITSHIRPCPKLMGER